MQALNDINFTIGANEIFGVIGESGSGKSTLLRCMNRLEEPSIGEIFLTSPTSLRLALVGLTNDYAAAAGLTLGDAISKESLSSPYVNLIVVRQDNQKQSLAQKLILVMHSERVIHATQPIFSPERALATWKRK